MAEASIVAAFVGALLGFLVFNFHPASIFMGDCGSLFIGSFLAIMALSTPSAGGSGVLPVIAVPLLLLLVPILDTTFVTVVRILSGCSVSVGGRDHTSHRLVAIGLSEPRAVMVLYAIAAIGGVLAFSLRHVGPTWTLVGVALYAVGVLLVLVYLGTVGVYSGADFKLLRNRSYTPLLMELTYRRRVFEVLLDFVLAAVADHAAYRIRFSGEEFALYMGVFLKSLPIVLACRIAALLAAGVYRGTWRFLSISDLGAFVRGVAFGSASAVLAFVYLYRFTDFSRALFVLDGLIFGALLIGSRFSFRLLRDAVNRRRSRGRRVIIYGAGDGGTMIVREILNNPALDMQPVGFIDDEDSKRGWEIEGFSVLGDIDKLIELV